MADSSLKDATVPEITEDNAAEIARKEYEAEHKVDPDKAKAAPAKPADSDTPPSDKEVPGDTLEDQPKTDDELLAAKDEDLTDTEKEQKKALLDAVEAEDKRLLDTPEDQLSAEDKEKRAAVVLKNEAKAKEDLEASINAYATDKKITVDNARKIFDSVAKIQSKYGKDPFELAKAVLENQHLITRKDDEIRRAREEVNRPRLPETVAEWESAIKTHGIAMANGQAIGWEKAIELYRAENSEATEGLADEQVLKLVAKEIKISTEANLEKEMVKVKDAANEKRDELLKTIPEENKEFAGEIERLLKLVPDSVVLKNDYDLEYVTRWARGGVLSPEKMREIVKEAELRGFERGKLASGKIVKTPVGSGGKPGGGKKTTSLSPRQKDEAREKFPDAKTDDEAFELYTDTFVKK